MKFYKRVVPVLLLFLLLPMQVFAAGSVDLSRRGSLTIHALCGTEPIENMDFRGYQVAAIDENGELTVTPAFAAYAKELDIRGKQDAAWQAMAQKLADNLPQTLPELTARTDAEGTALFSGFPLGLYLITGSRVEQKGYIYETGPFFVVVPEQNIETNTWNYSVTANAKPAKGSKVEDFQVIKKWDDSCHSSRRPTEISVRIYKDDVLLYDDVKLNKNNNWKFTWRDEVNHDWRVEEDKLDGYKTPVVTREGYVFTVLNQCDTPGNKLPQTGQLWWPVPVLLCCGLALVVFGLIRRRGDQDAA